MTELFEIGVSIALSDSVSSEIAKVQKEILSLGSVLSAGGVSPERLVATARKSSAPAGLSAAEQPPIRANIPESPSAMTNPAQVVIPAVQDIPETRHKLPQQLLPGVPSFTAAALSAFSVAETNPRADQRRSPDVKHFSIAAPISQSTFVVQPASPRSQPTFLSEDNFSAKPQAPDPPLALPTLRNFSNEFAFKRNPQEVVAPVGPTNRLFALGESEAPHEVTKHKPSVPPAAQLPVHRPFAPEQATRLLEKPISPARDSRAARSGWNNDSARPLEAPVSQHALERATPKASDSHGQNIQGDVYLDGALVGRWMSQVMARDAARASVGRTGFDVRRGRLLPGPTVG